MNIIPVLDCHTLCHVIDFIYSNETRCELEHVVSKRDDDELSVFRPFFNITCDNRDLVLLVLRLLRGIPYSLRF
jgi:hypothetical protein